MDSGLETALVSASIAAVVSVTVAIISPLFTHHLWKRQKRKEQQLAIAERYATFHAELSAYDPGVHDESRRRRYESLKLEMLGLLFVVNVLSEKAKVRTLADDVQLSLISPNPPHSEPSISGEKFFELQAYLFAEALDIPFSKVKV
jgi:hypothetical protein